MKSIKPTEINGTIAAPASKSMMQRATIAAALAHGTTILTNPTFCDDAKATFTAVKRIGAQKIKERDDTVLIVGGGKPECGFINCGESGTALRMLAPVTALFSNTCTLSGKCSLLNRPVGMIEEPLTNLGAVCTTNNGRPPIKIIGPIQGGKIKVDGSISSQFVSGLLMALPLCKEDSELEVVSLRSKAYVRMTESVLFQFGIKVKMDERLEHFFIPGNQQYRSRNYEIEGDWSGAACMLVAGALAGEIEITRLKSGIQPDQAIKNVLIQIGAEVVTKDKTITVRKSSQLSAFEFDATDCPDLFPPLAVLATQCEGKSIIQGTTRLIHKESNRAAVLASELNKIGANIRVVGDTMEIIGRKLTGGSIDPHNDHRIAMAGAIAGLVSEKGVRIENEGCISKSYPSFFKDLESVMVKR